MPKKKEWVSWECPICICPIDLRHKEDLDMTRIKYAACWRYLYSKENLERRQKVKSKDKTVLVTREKKTGIITEADENVYRDACEGRGILIETAEQFKAICNAVKATKDAFDEVVKDMTKEQAMLVRQWRIDMESSWRAVAQKAHEEGLFNRDWEPPSNQLMGMALCEKAALFFGEDYQQEPW